MAITGSTVLTLADYSKRFGDKDGGVSEGVVEMLSQWNGILDDAMWKQSNQSNSNVTTIRTALPTVRWGQLYKGTPNSKSSTTKIVDTMGMLEGQSIVDTRMERYTKDMKTAMVDESHAFFESMSNEWCSTLFYGNVAGSSDDDPSSFTGLTARYNTLSGNIGGQVLSGGGSGNDNSSIWIVQWGIRSLTCIFPENSTSGIQSKYKGEFPVLDSDSNTYYAHHTYFSWDSGLTVADYRGAVRICNIDMSNAQANSGAANIPNLLAQGLKRLGRPQQRFTNARDAGANNGLKMSNSGSVRTVIYMNRGVESLFDRQMNALTPYLGLGEGAGVYYPNYRGVPIVICDAILNTESAVS